MTPAQRRQLIEKHQQGTLTDEEYQRYLELLRTDSSFYDDVNLHNSLRHALREEASHELWETVGRSRAKLRARPLTSRFHQYHPYAYVLAACVALVIVGIWLFWPATTGPRIVRTGSLDLFRAREEAGSGTGRGYAGGDIPIGTIPVKWLENKELSADVAYRYCQDTLTMFIRSESDTLYLQAARLRYDARTRTLSVERPGRSQTIFRNCTSTPQPF